MSNATLRVVTALIGAPVVIGLLYVGGWAWGGLVLLGAVLAQRELYDLMEQGGLRPWRRVGLAVGALLALVPLVPMAFPLAVVIALAAIAASPFDVQDETPLVTLGATLLGTIYPAALFGALSALRLGRGAEVSDAEAFVLTLSVFLLVWATDTFAYYVGKNFGRHKLAPTVSPKKTWEGSVGGALGAVLVAVVLKVTLLGFLAWGHVVVIALICGIVSQLGDLTESKMKRSVGAKDSGSILPGHGGILDRFDAMILAAPLVYLYLAAVARVIE